MQTQIQEKSSSNEWSEYILSWPGLCMTSVGTHPVLPIMGTCRDTATQPREGDHEALDALLRDCVEGIAESL